MYVGMYVLCVHSMTYYVCIMYVCDQGKMEAVLCLHRCIGTVVTILSSCVVLTMVGYFNRSPENFVDGKWVQAAVMM